ncbi:MAG: hypothetical protein ACKODX_10825 [Gemmata sp.]
MGMLLYLGGAVVAFLFVVHFWDRLALRRLAARRAGESFDTFRAALADEGAPEYVLRGVYGLLQGFAARAVADFPVRAEDHIKGVYGMDDAEVEQGVRRLLAECGYRYPAAEQFAQMPPVHTVRDLVRAVLKCPKADGSSAG